MIGRLKELIQSEDSDLWDYKEELLALIDEALQAYRPTIPKTETTSCEWCKGEVGQYFDVFWYDFVNWKRGSVNYCPNCGRRLEEKNHGSKAND